MNSKLTGEGDEKEEITQHELRSWYPVPRMIFKYKLFNICIQICIQFVYKYLYNLYTICNEISVEQAPAAVNVLSKLLLLLLRQPTHILSTLFREQGTKKLMLILGTC